MEKKMEDEHGFSIFRPHNANSTHHPQLLAAIGVPTYLDYNGIINRIMGLPTRDFSTKRHPLLQACMKDPPKRPKSQADLN